MASKGPNLQTPVEITVISAAGLKDTKLFGTMSPTAVVSIFRTSVSYVFRASEKGGSSPTWNETAYLRVDDSALANNPQAKLEIFSSPKLSTSLGSAWIPLDPAVRRYDEPQTSAFQIMRQGMSGNLKPSGYINVSITIGKASFAPEKGSPEYQSFVNPPQPPPPAHGIPSYMPAATMPYGVPSGYPAPYGPQYGGYPPQGGYYPPPGSTVRVVDNRRGGFGGGGFGGAGAGLGVGLLAGGLGGLLIGDALSDGGGGCGGGGCGG